MPENHDLELLQRLKANDEKSMDVLFRDHYEMVCRTIFRILKDPNMSEDIAQDVFMEIWRKRETLQITTSFGAYLRRAASNRALNYIRDQRMKFDDVEFMPELKSNTNSSLQKLQKEELESLIHQTIDALPDRCRIVFMLSRFEELSYQEIATKLEISPKTVENQISKALKILRSSLAPYLKNGLLATLFCLVMS